MCLKVNEPSTKKWIAEHKDDEKVTVWKVIHSDVFLSGEPYVNSIHMSYSWQVGINYPREPYAHIEDSWYGYREVYGGAFHAYLTRESAEYNKPKTGSYFIIRLEANPDDLVAIGDSEDCRYATQGAFRQLTFTQEAYQELIDAKQAAAYTVD